MFEDALEHFELILQKAFFLDTLRNKCADVDIVTIFILIVSDQTQMTIATFYSNKCLHIQNFMTGIQRLLFFL